MQEKLDNVVALAKQEIAEAKSIAELANVKVKYLGKSGQLTEVMKGIKDLPNDQKPLFGKFVNDARDKITACFDESEAIIKTAEVEKKLASEQIDITIKGQRSAIGSLHPCTLVVNEILDIFTNLGFEVKQGPEIETDFFNFQALNIPKDHPAREMQDTFYISDDLLLRTHTSPVQVRNMLSSKPPIKIVNPGKVYRPDDDATHSPMFQQVEGLVIDKGINLCHLKGVLEQFAQTLFDKNTKTRLRPSYFPFTEPSVEVDVTCAICGGKGCRICKGTGWIEILGAGIVNPKVLQNCGIDSSVYSGFAFGMGVERIAMIKFGIPDMRILFENDIRFLRQYK